MIQEDAAEEAKMVKDLFHKASPKETEHWQNYLKEEAQKKADLEEELAEQTKNGWA